MYQRCTSSKIRRRVLTSNATLKCWLDMLEEIKLSKAQSSKIIQSRGFLGALLTKFARPLMKVAVPLAKIVLAP